MTGRATWSQKYEKGAKNCELATVCYKYNATLGY